MVRISVAALLTCTYLQHPLPLTQSQHTNNKNFNTVALSVYAVGDPSGEKNVGNGNGGQFITGRCLSDADCASGCCAGLQDGAICSARAVQFANGKQGCGFGGAGAGAGNNNGAGNGNGTGEQNNGGNGGNGNNCARSFQA